MNFIFIELIFIVMVIFLFPISWIILFKKNKSSLNIDLLNGESGNIGLNKKYEKLQQKHDEIYRKTKKEVLLVPFVITTFLCFLLTYVSWYFILGVPIMIVLVALLAASGDKTNEKIQLNKEYESIIFNDIIVPILEVKKSNQVDITETSSYDEVKRIEKYIEEQEKIISNVMNNTGKKCFKNYSIKYDLECQIKNNWFNIKKFSNSLKVSHSTNTSSINSNYIYSFVGYLITIPNFYNIERLNYLNKQDYYYDKNKNTLFLLISEELENDIHMFSMGKTKIKYNKSFDKQKILLKNYNFFNALKNYIISIIGGDEI